MRSNLYVTEYDASLNAAGLGGRDVGGRPAGPDGLLPNSIERDGPSAAEIAYRSGEVRDLRAEVDRLRGERDRLLVTQRLIMDLLQTSNSDRLIHDLRNVLNERELYKALAETTFDEPDR